MIALTASYDPGDLDPGQLYTHVMVVSTATAWHGAGSETVTLKWCYGTVVDSVFVGGKVKTARFTASNSLWVSRIETYTSVGGGEKSHAAWSIALHQLLLDESVVAGTLA